MPSGFFGSNFFSKHTMGVDLLSPPLSHRTGRKRRIAAAIGGSLVGVLSFIAGVTIEREKGKEKETLLAHPFPRVPRSCSLRFVMVFSSSLKSFVSLILIMENELEATEKQDASLARSSNAR